MSVYGDVYGEGESAATGTGDIPVTADTLDDDGDDMYVKTAAGAGIDDVLIRAYVTTEWDDDAITAPIRAETHSQADGSWEDVLMLDEGVQYTIYFSKSGFSFERTTVTP